jgi:HlyD family secretion protein
MISMKKLLLFSILTALAAVGVLVYRSLASAQSANATSLQTATVNLGSVAQTITGVGTVSSKQSAAVIWQTSGKVARVEVETGQQVKMGDLLASLDPNSLSVSIIQAQADLITAQKNLEALQKPDPLQIAEAEKALVQAQENLNNLLSPSAASILQAKKAVQDAQDAETTAQATINRLNRARGSSEQIQAAEATYQIAKDRAETAWSTYVNTPGTVSEDTQKAAAYTNYVSANTAANNALGTLNWYKGHYSEEEKAAAELDLAMAQANLVAAQDTLAALENPTPTDLALAQARVESAQEALDTVKAGATDEELIIAQTRVQVAQTTLNQARLTASFDGTITGVDVLEGDLVSQGKQAFQIDDLSMLFVVVQVSEVDISQVALNQNATITFDAISNKTYSGTVNKMGMTPTISQGVVNYPVTVWITDPDSDILPGMTAAVNIVIQEHAGVLVVPSGALSASGGQRIVTVLFEGQQIQVPVTVGLSSGSYVEVSSPQLREGDTVVLNSTTTTGSTTLGGQQFIRGEVPGGGGQGFMFP